MCHGGDYGSDQMEKKPKSYNATVICCWDKYLLWFQHFVCEKFKIQTIVLTVQRTYTGE